MLPNQSVCSACGALSEQTELVSTNAFGSPDLDLRPPEMQRSTMPYWVQTCSQCGFCASDIGKTMQGSRDLIAQPAYRDQLRNPDFPELANRFLCWAMIAEAEGAWADAAHASLHAAWACDDAQLAEVANTCRLQAIDRIRAAWDKGAKVVDGGEAEPVLLVDLLRRTGQFPEAGDTVHRVLRDVQDPWISKVFEFELSLIKAEDAAVHRLDEVPRD